MLYLKTADDSHSNHISHTSLRSAAVKQHSRHTNEHVMGHRRVATENQAVTRDCTSQIKLAFIAKLQQAMRVCLIKITFIIVE
jgi:hypothetical protein